VLPIAISRLLFNVIVHGPINLHCQRQFGAVEIDDVSLDSVLPAKLQAAEPAVAKRIP